MNSMDQIAKVNPIRERLSLASEASVPQCFITMKPRKSSRLDAITDWEARAETVRFRVSGLAKGCGVTDRQLRRYFQTKFGSPPHAWMMIARLQKARPYLSDGELVKEVAARAGFKHPESFSRQFKRHYSTSPAITRADQPTGVKL